MVSRAFGATGFGAEQLLGLLAAGLSVEEIQEDFPFIEVEDVREVLRYATVLAHRDFYLPTRESA